MRIDITPKQINLFWQKVRKAGPDECWEWTACIGFGGYGKVSVGNRRTEAAHRVAYFLANGDIPDDKPCILHRCDNRKCVNPSHLFAGTKRENTHDMYAKGRACQQTGTWTPQRGSTNTNAKLDESKVLAIRAKLAEGIDAYTIAAEYGVSPGLIYHIKHRRNWTHV